MLVGDGGGGGWDGTISVVPGDLAAASPGFWGVAEAMNTASLTVSVYQGADSVGITDQHAAAAWNRFAAIWVHDLNALGATYSDTGDHLVLGAEAYTKTDHTIESKLDLDYGLPPYDG
jgi:Excreted virulence factor EspC, type VII ESX diderm